MLRNKYKYREQINMADCGVAALAMLLENYNSYHSSSEIRNLAQTDDTGTTVLGISKAARSLGMETKAIKADESLLNMENLQFPFIAHVIKEKTLLHYYVVYKITKRYIVIADPDPSVGIIKMNREDFLEEWTGVSIFIAPGSNFNPQNNRKKSSLSNLIPLIFNQRKIIFNIILATFITTLIIILTSLFFRVIIDYLIPRQLVNTLSIISIGLILAQVIQKIIEYGKNYLLIVIGQRFSIDITLSYIKRLFQVPISYFYSRSIGDIVSRFRDASAIIDAIASIFISSILDFLILIVISIILWIQVPNLFVVLLISLPFFIIIILLFIKPFEKQNREVLESNAKLSTSIIDDLYGIETIKSLNKEKSRYDKIDKEFVSFLKNDLKYNKSNILQMSLKQGIQLIISTLILWMGSSLVISNKVSLGQLITFNSLITYFFSPLENIINLQPKLQEGKVAYERIQDIFYSKLESDTDNKLGFQKEFSNGSINFENISYQYGYGKDVLHELSMTIPRNSKVTLTGKSGSGKSTLAKMLVKFYLPTTGNIYINSTNIKDIETYNLRENITYLPQQPYIFTGTIMENLLLDGTNIQNKEIEEVLDAVTIKEEIEKMPMGYNTRISSDGSGLSGGQKQRLALARALMSDSEILILDEATSSLDGPTEQKVLNYLFSLPQKTIIFIAHGSVVSKKADIIYVMDNGQIVEEGTHTALLNKKGYYYDLQREWS